MHSVLEKILKVAGGGVPTLGRPLRPFVHPRLGAIFG